jgi:hypothetical protein
MTSRVPRGPADGPPDRPAGVDPLRRHLHAALPQPPMESMDWERVAEGIRARAEPLLAVRRRSLPWWRHTSRWARIGIPLAAAATLALVLSVPSVRPRPFHAAPLAETSASQAGARVALAEPPATEDPVLAFMTASDDGEALLLSALEEE